MCEMQRAKFNDSTPSRHLYPHKLTRHNTCVCWGGAHACLCARHYLFFQWVFTTGSICFCMIWVSDLRGAHNSYSRVTCTWLLFLTCLPMPWPTTAQSFQGVWLWSCLCPTYHTIMRMTPVKLRNVLLGIRQMPASIWTSLWMCCQTTSLSSFITLRSLERHAGAQRARARQDSF